MRTALFLIAIGVAGCDSPRTGTVVGKVNAKGVSPGAEKLAVTILTSSGQTIAVPVQDDGSFTIANVPVGPARLGISVAVDHSSTTTPVSFHNKKDALPFPMPRPHSRQPFAARYVNPRTSGFVAEVQSGKVVEVALDVP